MAQPWFLILMSAVCLAAALRLAAVRRRRLLRESSRLRRLAKEKRWQEATGQIIADDWRS